MALRIFSNVPQKICVKSFLTIFWCLVTHGSLTLNIWWLFGGVLKLNQFVANEDKCSFGKQEIDYLGHIISRKGVAVDPNKVHSVLKWLSPTNVKGVRGFLELTRYDKRFIVNYG